MKGYGLVRRVFDKSVFISDYFRVQTLFDEQIAFGVRRPIAAALECTSWLAALSLTVATTAAFSKVITSECRFFLKRRFLLECGGLLPPLWNAGLP